MSRFLATRTRGQWTSLAALTVLWSAAVTWEFLHFGAEYAILAAACYVGLFIAAMMLGMSRSQRKPDRQ